MVFRTTIYFLLLIASPGFAQSGYDSLMRLARIASHDSARAWFMNGASVVIRETDADKAMQLALEAQRLAYKANFKKGVAATLTNIGWINHRKGFYSEALALSTEALKIDRELADAKEISDALNNIGAINFEQRKYQESLRAFKEAYEKAQIASHRTGMSRSLNNIAFCFLRLGQLDSARYYTNKSINDGVNDLYRTSFSYRMLGDIAYEEKNFGEALKHYQTCLENAIRQKNNFLRVSTQFRIGKTLIKLDQPDQAITLLQQNVIMATYHKYKRELESTYLVLSDAYRAKKDFANAMKYQTLHYQLKDSLSEERRGEITELIQSTYQTEIKNAQIELLTKDSMLKENELRGQRLLMYVGIGILVVLAVLIFNLVQSNQRNKLANRMLSQQNELINDQSRQLEVLNKTKDKILSIISHDMRSPLAGLKGLVTLMSSESITQQEFTQVSMTLRKNLDYVSNDLDNLLHWANAQVKGIKPQFENVNVHDVVVEQMNLFSEVSKNKSIQFEVDVPDKLAIWADINHVRLVLRNLVSNAIKFSREQSHILISARPQDNGVAIEVKDFGVGMSQDEVARLFKIEDHFSKAGTQNEKGVGLGLMLVKEFVETNKGSISVASKPGEGTRFTIHMQPGRIEA
ncbi:MAG: ATP-binding protein [Flammeovirgaceae bacterium]